MFEMKAIQFKIQGGSLVTNAFMRDEHLLKIHSHSGKLLLISNFYKIKAWHICLLNTEREKIVISAKNLFHSSQW